jgi:hypothetical protein
MTRLDFVTEPSFKCPNDKAGDVAFIKATHEIGGRDAVKEYMASGLFPLSVSFNLGEIVDGKHRCQSCLSLCQRFLSPYAQRR